jgi:hypothetical protein
MGWGRGRGGEPEETVGAAGRWEGERRGRRLFHPGIIIARISLAIVTDVGPAPLGSAGDMLFPRVVLGGIANSGGEGAGGGGEGDGANFQK